MNRLCMLCFVAAISNFALGYDWLSHIPLNPHSINIFLIFFTHKKLFCPVLSLKAKRLYQIVYISKDNLFDSKSVSFVQKYIILEFISSLIGRFYHAIWVLLFIFSMNFRNLSWTLSIIAMLAYPHTSHP